MPLRWALRYYTFRCSRELIRMTYSKSVGAFSVLRLGFCSILLGAIPNLSEARQAGKLRVSDALYGALLGALVSRSSSAPVRRRGIAHRNCLPRRRGVFLQYPQYRIASVDIPGLMLSTSLVLGSGRLNGRFFPGGWAPRISITFPLTRIRI